MHLFVSHSFHLDDIGNSDFRGKGLSCGNAVARKMVDGCSMIWSPSFSAASGSSEREISGNSHNCSYSGSGVGCYRCCLFDSSFR